MLDRSAPEDDDLIARACGGDRAAFATVVDRHAGAVLRLARAMTTDAATADDVAQEAFLNAFRAAATYRPGVASVRTWLFAIARNVARRYRHTREQPAPLFDDGSLTTLGLEAGWGQELPELALGHAEETERPHGQRRHVLQPGRRIRLATPPELAHQAQGTSSPGA